MKASELRIGNMVCVLVPAVERIVDLKIITRIDGGDRTYKPIPLTEEWLVKFGFKKSDRFWIEDNYLVMLYEDGFRLAGSDYSTYSLNIKYVHQLQNLYLALTGEELTLSK